MLMPRTNGLVLLRVLENLQSLFLWKLRPKQPYLLADLKPVLKASLLLLLLCVCHR